jgi:cytochrome c553
MSRSIRNARSAVAIGLTFLIGLGLVAAERVAAAEEPAEPFPVPDWLFPIVPPAGPAPSAPPADDPSRRLRVPGSEVTFTRAETRNYFAVPDWFPHAHPAMPDVVAHGRRPDVYACGFCHLPDGAGRPENATLAGLPSGYIVQQWKDFASGARRSAWPGSPYLPDAMMEKLSALVTEEEVATAAAYFSRLHLRGPRATVVETGRIPKIRTRAWLHTTTDAAGDEPLGLRLIEVPRDFALHELRDPGAGYVAYVPLGSVERGRRLATEGNGSAPPCTSCHGPELRGLGLVPPIAGRSPTYLLRQLVAFRTGARASAAGLPMRQVVAHLEMTDMIAIAAYTGSLAP